MVTFFTGFAGMFVDAGMSMATVQREKITQAQVSNLFWLAACLGCVMALVTAAASPAIAWFYGKPELIPIVITLAIPFVFAGLTTQHRALLTRVMRFKDLAIINLTALLLSQILAIGLAWRYHNYWSLVAAQIAFGALTMVATWWMAAWLPGRPSRRSNVRSMVGFGAQLTAFNAINYFSRNADNLLIGKFWGAGELGVYNMAYKLFMLPISKINGPMGAVAVPALSRLLDHPHKYRNYYLGMLEKLALITLPAAALMCFAADWIVPVLLGPGWEEAIPILRVLAVAGFFQAIANTYRWLFNSQGRGKEQLFWGLCICPLTLLLSFLIGLPWGALGVAIFSTLVWVLIITPHGTYLVTRKGHVDYRGIMNALPLPIILSATLLASVTFVRYGIPGLTEPLSLALAVSFSMLLSISVLSFLPSGQRLLASIRSTFGTLKKT